jgi:hypothetical protein
MYVGPVTARLCFEVDEDVVAAVVGAPLGGCGTGTDEADETAGVSELMRLRGSNKI